MFFVTVKHYETFTPYFFGPFGAMSWDGTSVISNMCNMKLRCWEGVLLLKSSGIVWPVWTDLVVWTVQQHPYAMIFFFFFIHNVETKNRLALNFKPLHAFPWEWAFLANYKFLNITSPITFSQVSIYAGLAFQIHGAGTGLRLNALQVAFGALGSLTKLVPDGHTVWVITSAH